LGVAAALRDAECHRCVACPGAGRARLGERLPRRLRIAATERVSVAREPLLDAAKILDERLGRRRRRRDRFDGGDLLPDQRQRLAEPAAEIGLVARRPDRVDPVLPPLTGVVDGAGPTALVVVCSGRA
jgi:hypothetical protein